MVALERRGDWPDILTRMRSESLGSIAEDLGISPGSLVAAWRRGADRVAEPRVALAVGDGTLVAWRVAFGRRDGSQQSVVVARTAERARALARSAKGQEPSTVVAVGELLPR